MKIDPRNVGGLNVLGLAHKAMGNSHIAVDLWKRAVNIDKKDYLGHMNLAAAYLEMKQSEAASLHSSIAIKLHPPNQEVGRRVGESVFLCSLLLCIVPSCLLGVGLSGG